MDRPLWRRTPPAIFPICLGFMGLGLVWRDAARILPLPREVGDLLLGASTAFFLYFLALYTARLVARPGVLFADMKTAPSRAGVAAAAMSLMLLAAALLPFGISVPQVWWTGVVLQIAASAVVCHAIWRDPPGTRAFSPFQYLTFVGPVVGPIAGIPLGYVRESLLLTLAALVAYLIVTGGLVAKLWRVRPPQPLRPSLAIFLAPTSLFALSFGALQFDGAFALFYWVSNVTGLGLLGLGRWMTRGGWTPIWGAFTFPLAAFTNMQVMAADKGFGWIAEAGIWSGLALGTPLILYIVYRAGLAWVTGALSRASGAAAA